MNETINVKVSGKELSVTAGTTLYEISKKFEDSFKYPIIIAKIDNEYKELQEKVNTECEIEFYDLTARDANRMYTNGLIMLTTYAYNLLYGNNETIKIKHSIDRGIYVETSIKIDEDKIKILEEKMNEIVKNDEKIEKMTTPRKDAIKYFNAINNQSAAEVLKYITNTYITLYRMGVYYDYFYTEMPYSTGALKEYKLTYLNDRGFILRYHTVYAKEIEEYHHHEMLFETFKKETERNKIINIENVAKLNQLICNGKIGNLIRIQETLQSSSLLEIAKEIADKKDIKIILVAGPSSSGKTTTSIKLSMYLKSFGLNPTKLSMDDYFKERDDTPKNEDGTYDFECIEALDVDLFNKHMKSLLENEKVTIPTFNFITGQKEYKNELKLEHDDILIIEGIHALSDVFLKDIDKNKKYKIYISPLTSLNINDHNKISTSDVRLLRRIVRDNRTRGYTPEETISRWPKVRIGEEKYIFPNQDNADTVFNTSLIYEIGVLKTYAVPLLYLIENSSIYYEEAKRLIDFLNTFLAIPADAIPEDSILREFIGGGCFHE